MPIDVVRRPDVWTLYRAPRPPTDAPKPVFEMLIRTPGAILTLRRNRIDPTPKVSRA
jgi:hypothetical protein